MKRREVLKAGLVLIAGVAAASIYRPAGAVARIMKGGTKWLGKSTLPPVPVDANQRMFLTDREVAQVSAIFDRLIPADEISISASAAGCVTFLDHQLGGPYGKGQWKYLTGPARQGSDAQGDQSLMTPAEIYRTGLAEMDGVCQQRFGKAFDALDAAEQDSFLEAMEANHIALPSMPSARLFSQFLANVQEGYFADPVYGGNRGMAGWNMIGFPGARYDYRDYVDQKNQKLDIVPISIVGRI